MTLKMPARLPDDGAIAVTRPTDTTIAIVVHSARNPFALDADGRPVIDESAQPTAVVMSEYNAWRAFGLLAVMLGIPLPPSIGKAIKL